MSAPVDPLEVRLNKRTWLRLERTEFERSGSPALMLRLVRRDETGDEDSLSRIMIAFDCLDAFERALAEFMATT